jgi:hypothetical protein
MPNRAASSFDSASQIAVGRHPPASVGMLVFGLRGGPDA